MNTGATEQRSRGLQPDRCPPDPAEVAEAYVMDNLPKADMASFGEHVLACAGCRRAVEDADRYGKALQTAMRRLRVEPGRG
jgi:hypothetical protein